VEYERTIALGARIAEALALAPTIPQQCTNRPPRCSQIIRQAGLRTHERTLRCWRIAFPHPSKGAVALRFAVARLPLRGQRRNYSVSDHRMVEDLMHRLPVSLAVAPGRTEKTAEHLTTSLRMLTAVRGIGKVQTRLILSGVW
jgi:hypothetical protein